MFKAGINMGHVTVAEVGVIKRGIEYMSDVLNTAARIEGKCNEYGCNLLVSVAVKDRLAPEEAFHVEHKGSVLLRGKVIVDGDEYLGEAGDGAYLPRERMSVHH